MRELCKYTLGGFLVSHKISAMGMILTRKRIEKPVGKLRIDFPREDDYPGMG